VYVADRVGARKESPVLMQQYAARISFVRDSPARGLERSEECLKKLQFMLSCSFGCWFLP
jgi:hypothetical protein